MPSLYKRADTPLYTRQVPVSAVTVQNEAAETELSARIEEHIVHEIDRRWREACARLEETEADLRRALAAESQRVLASARQEGYAAGLREAREVLENEMAVVRKAYVQLEHDRLAFVEESQHDIAALAQRMAEVMLRAELKTNQDALLTLFHAAYDELVAQRKVFVFVHPTQLFKVEALKHLLPLPVDAPIVVRTDSTLDVDSFRLEDELGGVRYDLPAELRQLGKEVLCGGL